MQVAGSVIVSPAVDTIGVGDTLRLLAEAFDGNGNPIGGASFEWSSSDAVVAAVSDVGMVRGGGQGTATITATAGDAHGTSAITVVNPDRAALEALYHATGGPNWNNTGNWLSDRPIGEWYGVTVNAEGRVATLFMQGNNLIGSIPPELGGLSELERLELSFNGLSGPIPPELKELSSLRYLEAGSNSLTGAIPAELGELSSLEFLSLSQNRLSGPIPPALGDLSRLTHLAIGANQYGGPIPPELGRLSRLRVLSLRSAQLTGGIPPELGALASMEDINLFGNQLSGPIPVGLFDRMAGLRTLWLTDNRLTGPIPAEIGALSRLESLALSRNQLSGRIPPEIGNLTNLRLLYLGLNRLSGPIPPEIGNLTNLEQLRLYTNDLTGPIPPEIGNLANLTDLWASYNELSGPIPPEIGNLTNLTHIWLHYNLLTGPLPAELGNLTNLQDLRLELNEITGELPPEMGRLSRLERIDLSFNRLSGPIPPEFGNLTSLRTLSIFRYENRLTGEIPPELGNLANLQALRLPGNELTGELPPELGDLQSLVEMTLSGNDLTGELPPELGNLGALTYLKVERNNLSGPIPPEFGNMSALRELAVTNNPEMAGPLPSDLTMLSSLNTLMAAGTGLCAPSDPDFRHWLIRVYRRRIGSCGGEGAGSAYLTQAVQSREFTVPLVAGERAQLRVFLTATTTNTADIPGVRARFHVDGDEIHSQYVAGKTGPIPTEVAEGELAQSLNAEVPASVIRPGLEMVIEVDSVDAGLGVPRRIPASGRLKIEAYSVSSFDITAIPFLWNANPDSSIIDLVDDMAGDPGGHELLRDTHTLLPIAGLNVTAHEPVLTSSNHAIPLLVQTEAIRVAEGGEGYYMGTMRIPPPGVAGVAITPGKSSFSIPDVSVIAHEFGHNLSLLHAPCYVEGDPSYPHDGGRIGAWGWDFRDGGQLVSPSATDLMGYCHDKWISDFHFTNAMRFRAHRGDTTTEMSHARAKGLLLWGGMREDGTPYLEPAFVLDAPPTLPRRAGEYRIEGRDGDGAELFSLSFDMPVVADADGASGFAFVVPDGGRLGGGLGRHHAFRPRRIGDPGRGRTSGPPPFCSTGRTGQVRGILADLPPNTLAHADAAALLSPGPGLVLRFSRGIPDAEAWR